MSGLRRNLESLLGSLLVMTAALAPVVARESPALAETDPARENRPVKLNPGAGAGSDGERERMEGQEMDEEAPQADAPPESTGKSGKNKPKPGRPNLNMKYQGVAPGRAELPPHPLKLPLGKGPQRLTWPGFQMREGKPTVFLQLSGPVEYSVKDRPGQLLITLYDTVANVRNNLRPLIVEEFKTPVRRISFEIRKAVPKTGQLGAVVVTVAVRGEVAHQERLDSAENGYSMLLVQVTPAGDAPAGGEAPPAPPRPAAKDNDAPLPFDAKSTEAKPAPAKPAPAKPNIDPMTGDEQNEDRRWIRPKTLQGAPAAPPAPRR